MKNRYSLLLGLAILAIAGCTQDLEDVNMGTLPISHQIHIEGSINQEYASRVNDGGFCTGDQIGLYGVNYTDNNTLAGELLDEGNQVDNARYTFDAENWVWTSSGNVYYKDSKTNIDLYGYYPYGTVNRWPCFTRSIRPMPVTVSSSASSRTPLLCPQLRAVWISSRG